MIGAKPVVLLSMLAAVLASAAAGRPASGLESSIPATAVALSPAAPLSAPSSTPQTNGAAPANSGASAQTAPSISAAAASAATAPAPPLDPPAAAWKLLTEGVDSDKYPTRSDAVAALAILETDRRAVRLMIKALQDKNPIIRVQAAASLGESKAHAAIPALRAALDDKEPQVSFAAAEALWGMGDRSGREDFLEILSGERKTQPGVIASNIAKAKAEMHDPKGLVLIGINSASQAMLGPGSLGVSAVEELATNKTAPVEALCAKLLGEDDNPDSVGELKEALGDKNWTVRAAAARALAGMNHPEAIPLLENMMANDKKDAARFVAAAAIIRLDERERLRADRKPRTPSPETGASSQPTQKTPAGDAAAPTTSAVPGAQPTR